MLTGKTQQNMPGRGRKGTGYLISFEGMKADRMTKEYLVRAGFDILLPGDLLGEDDKADEPDFANEI